MTQTARYLFDLDFAAPPEPEIEEEIEEIPPEPMITVAEHEQLLADAIKTARVEGEQTARADREQTASEQQLAVQKEMLDDVSMIYSEVGLLMERLERDASNLAFAFASRFAEKLVAQEPKTEVLGLLHQIMGPLRQTPHITIRLSEDIAEDIRLAMDQQMAELGFDGKLSIIPDPAIMPGDCEVEWADGGIGRNLRSAVRQVEQLLNDHFAHLPPPEQDEPQDEKEPQDDQPGDEPDETSQQAQNTGDDGTSNEPPASEEPPVPASDGDPTAELTDQPQQTEPTADPSPNPGPTLDELTDLWQAEDAEASDPAHRTDGEKA